MPGDFPIALDQGTRAQWHRVVAKSERVADRDNAKLLSPGAAIRSLNWLKRGQLRRLPRSGGLVTLVVSKSLHWPPVGFITAVFATCIPQSNVSTEFGETAKSSR